MILVRRVESTLRPFVFVRTPVVGSSRSAPSSASITTTSSKSSNRKGCENGVISDFLIRCTNLPPMVTAVPDILGQTRCSERAGTSSTAVQRLKFRSLGQQGNNRQNPVRWPGRIEKSLRFSIEHSLVGKKTSQRPRPLLIYRRSAKSTFSSLRNSQVYPSSGSAMDQDGKV